MSPTGLGNFLEGSTPYGKTLSCIQAWYYREAGLQRVPVEEIRDQLRRIVATLPEPDVGVRELLEAVDRSFATAGMMSPEWVRGVERLIARETH
jgi:hypothetical protein